MIDLTDYPTPWKVREGDLVWFVEDARDQWVCSVPCRDIAHMIAASPELFVAASDVCESATYIGKRELAYRVPLTPIDTLEMSLTKSRAEVK